MLYHPNQPSITTAVGIALVLAYATTLCLDAAGVVIALETGCFEIQYTMVVSAFALVVCAWAEQFAIRRWLAGLESYVSLSQSVNAPAIWQRIRRRLYVRPASFFDVVLPYQYVQPDCARENAKTLRVAMTLVREEDQSDLLRVIHTFERCSDTHAYLPTREYRRIHARLYRLVRYYVQEAERR